MIEIITLTGNTIRLTSKYKDFSGADVDPDLINFKVYDSRYQILEENVVSDANKTGVGSYFYDYTTENNKGTYYFEWYAEIAGNPAVSRGIIKTAFIV